VSKLLKNSRILVDRLKNQGLKITALWLFSRGFSWITGIPILKHSLVDSKLYVGPQYNRYGLRHLKRAHVQAVVNLRKEYDDAVHGLLLDEYCYLPTNDDDAPTIEQLKQGVEFIRQQHTAGKRVYIHCGGGIGRAPTMAAAYLIAEGYSLDDAVAMIKRVRPFINITPSQMEKLKEWQRLFRAENF
jgi:protein-tyrosine phosphatase